MTVEARPVIRGGSFVAGRWYEPTSDRRIRIVNPADPSELLAEFPAAGRDDTVRAIDAAQAAWPRWRDTPSPERGRVLWRAADIARRRLEEIAQVMSLEEGKILRESRGEVMKGIGLLEYYAGDGFRIAGKTLPSEVRNTHTYTLRRPLGVVGLITPWNFPWAIPVWKTAPALVAGNTVVFKPASLTPGTAALFMEILEEAGLPPGVANMVVGSGADVGDTIVGDPRVQAVSFTGSNSVGMSVNSLASQRGARVTCEMGGKNAVVVMADADLGAAVEALIGGAFGATGQRCTATSRLVVHREVKAELLERLVAKAATLKLGPGLDESSDLAPAVDRKQFETNLEYIDVARSEGARLVYGGNAIELGGGYFVEPTLFDGVTPEMRIFQEEVFGPVLAVSEVSSLDEAIVAANAVEFGLASAIFTTDHRTAMRFIEESEVGMVHVNEPTIGGEAQLPFGGSKSTGVGPREMGEEGLHFFTEVKTVFVNYSGSGERALIR
ncbi:MAG: aldehyde dehydrogenase family protein [Trueperaceae bacterium]